MTRAAGASASEDGAKPLPGCISSLHARFGSLELDEAHGWLRRDRKVGAPLERERMASVPG
jgi:hypothetical protein